MRGWMSSASNSYLPPINLGQVMRGSGVGRVLAGDAFPKGQLVSCHPNAIGWQQVGICDSTFVIPLPEYLLPRQLSVSIWAGMLGGTGLTAYFGLLEVGQARPGELVVVSSAAGAVGSMVCQLAKHVLKCNVIGIAGGPNKCAWCISELGIDQAVDYQDESFALRLRQAVQSIHRLGAHVIFDNVGGKVLDVMLQNLAIHARVVLCGSVSGVKQNPIENVGYLIVRQAKMMGFLLFEYEKRYQEAYVNITKWINEKRLKITAEECIIGLENAPHALQRLFTGNKKGKLVVQVSKEEEFFLSKI